MRAHVRIGLSPCIPSRMLMARLILWALLLCLSFCTITIYAADDPQQVSQVSYVPWASDFIREHGCIRKIKQQKRLPDLDEELLSLLHQSMRYNVTLFSVFVTGKDAEHERGFLLDGITGTRIRRMHCEGARPVVITIKQKDRDLFANAGVLAYYSATFKKALKRAAGDEIEDINVLRWLLIESIARAGLNGIYVDLDVFWFGDLRREYGSRDYDILVQAQGNLRTLPSEPQTESWQESAAIHEEHICCQATFAGICTGVMMFRATPLVVDLAMKVRAHHLVGPCENMQVSVLQLREWCAPGGPLACGHFHPDRGVISSHAFEQLRRRARAEDGSNCGSGTGLECSQKVLLEQGPLLVHLDDSNDKIGPTELLEKTWPVTCDLQTQNGRKAHDEI